MADGIVINVNPKATYRRPGQINKRNAILSKPNAPLSYRPKVVSRTKAVLAKRKTSAHQRVNTKMIGGQRKVWSKHRQHVSHRELELHKEEIQIKKKKFKKPNYANKQIMGLNATFDKNTQTPSTQFPSNPYESVAGSGSMMVGFGGGIPGPSIVAPNEKEKNYMPKKTFSKFKEELVVEARMTGRDKLAKLMQPHLNAMGNTAAKLKKNAAAYDDVVKKYPAKPANEEHTKCDTDDCCGECK